jgi:hypothetical protein
VCVRGGLHSHLPQPVVREEKKEIIYFCLSLRLCCFRSFFFVLLLSSITFLSPKLSRSALIFSCMHERVDVVKLLLESGADVSIVGAVPQQLEEEDDEAEPHKVRA